MERAGISYAGRVRPLLFRERRSPSGISHLIGSVEMLQHDHRVIRALCVCVAAGLVGREAVADEPAVETAGSVNAPYTDSTKPAEAADTSHVVEEAGKPWKFMIAPYLWIPAQHGTIGVRHLTADVSMSVGDTWNALWDNFRFAGCLHLEAEKDRWTIFGDAMYMHLGNDVKNLPVSVDYKSGIFELGTAYAVHKGPLPGADSSSTVQATLAPLVGVRLWYLDTEIYTPFGSRGMDETWVDGFAGVRGELAFNETFSLSGRVDVGTGMSELTWNALAMVNVNFNKNISIFAGWRWLSDDYSKGSGASRFEYDMMFNGPFTGLKITF